MCSSNKDQRCVDCGVELDQDKKDFIREYVLARASTVTGNINIFGAARDAAEVYDKFIA